MTENLVEGVIRCESCTAKLDTSGVMGKIVSCPFCGTENVLSDNVRRLVVQNTREMSFRLTKAMGGMFSHEEILKLIVDYNLLVEHDTNRMYADNCLHHSVDFTIMYWCEFARRRGTLQEWADVVISHRPSISI